MAKAPKQEPLSVPMQEAQLALLCYHTKHGEEALSILTADDFDGIYKTLAQRVIRFRYDHKKPPGVENMGVLIDNLPLPEKQLDLLHTFNNQLGTISTKFNGAYLVKQVHHYIRHRTLTTATRDLAKVLSNTKQQAEEVADAERILYDALKRREAGYNAPRHLGDIGRIIGDMSTPRERPFPLNIDMFTRHDVGPMPGHMLLYISRKSSGKTWFCVHAAKCAYLTGKQVLHISLEMSAQEVEARYVQSLARIGINKEHFVRTKLIKGDWVSEAVKPEIHRGYGIDDPAEAKALGHARQVLHRWKSRLAGVYIEAFPTGSLTVEKLTTYLDFLQSHHNYSPHMLIIDYPDLMALDPKNIRTSLIDTYKRLRGVAVERNLALVCPTQSNRGGFEENEIRSSNVSEAIDKVFTADTVLSYSQTDGEKANNLARLKVNHARTTTSDIQVVLAQAYHIGQYVTDSQRIWKGYHEQVKDAEDKLKRQRKGELPEDANLVEDEDDDIRGHNSRGSNVVEMRRKRRNDT